MLHGLVVNLRSETKSASPWLSRSADDRVFLPGGLFIEPIRVSTLKSSTSPRHFDYSPVVSVSQPTITRIENPPLLGA